MNLKSVAYACFCSCSICYGAIAGHRTMSATPLTYIQHHWLALSSWALFQGGYVYVFCTGYFPEGLAHLLHPFFFFYQLWNLSFTRQPGDRNKAHMGCETHYTLLWLLGAQTDSTHLLLYPRHNTILDQDVLFLQAGSPSGGSVTHLMWTHGTFKDIYAASKLYLCAVLPVQGNRWSFFLTILHSLVVPSGIRYQRHSQERSRGG